MYNCENFRVDERLLGPFIYVPKFSTLYLILCEQDREKMPVRWNLVAWPTHYMALNLKEVEMDVRKIFFSSFFMESITELKLLCLIHLTSFVPMSLCKQEFGEIWKFWEQVFNACHPFHTKKVRENEKFEQSTTDLLLEVKCSI